MPAATPGGIPKEETAPADPAKRQDAEREERARLIKEQEAREKEKADVRRINEMAVEKAAKVREAARLNRQAFDSAMEPWAKEIAAVPTLEEAAALKKKQAATLLKLVPDQERDSLAALFAKLDGMLESEPLHLTSLENHEWTFKKGGPVWVVYERNGIEMPFRIIHLTPDGERMAIAAIEMPAELPLKAKLLVHTPGDGPQVWSAGATTSTYVWSGATDTLRFIQRTYLGGGTLPGLIAPGLDAGPHPMAPVNFVTVAQATFIASALGGELPPRALWDKAVLLAQQMQWSKEPRLRGEAYATEESYLHKYEARALQSLQREEPGTPAGSLPLNRGPRHWPDWGSYARGEGTAGGAKGKLVWFSRVDRESHEHPEGIYDLVGNVAEYVVGNDGQTVILGASAISAPVALPNKAYPVLSPVGYSDVGFRLAVRIPGRADDRLVSFKSLVAGWLASVK